MRVRTVPLFSELSELNPVHVYRSQNSVPGPGPIMSVSARFAVESLVHQCYHYIAMNLEKFSVSYLSLLPLRVRKELLWRLPIADLYMLEDTEYVEGFQDMEAYWKLPCRELNQEIPTGDPNIARYLEEWDSVEYKKAVLYSQVAIAVIGCRDPFEKFSFYLPFEDELPPHNQGMMIPMDNRGLVLSPLYAVRKPSRDGGCELSFPPRYHEMNDMASKRDIINAIIRCFKGKLPKLMGRICLHKEVDPDYFDLLSEVAYIGIYDPRFSKNFRSPTSRFLEQIIQRSTYLEVLILEGNDNEQTLDNFFMFLSTQVSFLSRFRLFFIIGYFSNVLQDALNKLISAYFSAPTTHLQKIRITDTRINSYDGDNVPPVINQRYLQFKTIELEDCYFISKQESTRRAITQWLGQDISTLHATVEKKKDNFCIFKVKERAASSLLGRKRKRSEVNDSEDT